MIFLAIGKEFHIKGKMCHTTNNFPNQEKRCSKALADKQKNSRASKQTPIPNNNESVQKCMYPRKYHPKIKKWH